MDQSPSRSQPPELLDNLLHGVNEWKNIQDIVRITFKALYDVVKGQGSTIAGLERTINDLRVVQSDVRQEVGTFATKQDLVNRLTELELRVDPREFKQALETKIGKSEFAHAISKKVGMEDIRKLTESFTSSAEVQDEIRKMHDALEVLENDLWERVSTLPQTADFEDLASQISDRAKTSSVQAALDATVTQDQLKAAMSRKADLSEIETWLSRKADIHELHTVIGAVEAKADQTWVEQLLSRLDDKVDRSEIALKILPELAKKPDKTDFDILYEQLTQTRKDIDRRLEDFTLDIDSHVGGIQADIENFKTKLQNGLASKVETREIDKLWGSVSGKVDTETVNELLHIQKSDYEEAITTLHAESCESQRRFQDLIFEKTTESGTTLQATTEAINNLTADLSKLADTRVADAQDQSHWVKGKLGALRSKLTGEFNELLQDVAKLSQTVDEVVHRKLEKQELTDTRARLTHSLQQKADVTEVQTAISAAQKDVAKTIHDLKEEFKSTLRRIEKTQRTEFDKKADSGDLDKIARTRLEVTQFEIFAKSVASHEQFRRLQDEIGRCTSIFTKFVTAEELTAHLKATTHTLEDISKDMLLKANIKDV